VASIRGVWMEYAKNMDTFLIIHCILHVPKKLDDMGFKWSSVTAKSKPVATLKDGTSTGGERPVKENETTDMEPTIGPTNDSALKQGEDSPNKAATGKTMESIISEELSTAGTDSNSHLASPKPLDEDLVKASSSIEI
jgi:hypothetical protein